MRRLEPPAPIRPEPVMPSPSSTLFSALLALACVAGPASAAGGEGGWYYTLGEVRENQQGNFCTGPEDVAELASIFRKYGVRPGFAALSNSPNCAMRVSTFTPHEIVEVVEIAKGEPNEYRIRFIRVEVHGAGPSYLVTTRDVRPADY